MPFIRLSDNYIDHPKFLALSDGAFRLWHEGMAFCRKHQTDGAIPAASLQGFRYYKPLRATELATPYQEGASPLWEKAVPGGFRVHDYLFWNLSKAEEQSEKDAATTRMRRLRKSRRDAVCSPVRDVGCSPEHIGERSLNVLDRTGSDRTFEKSEKPLPPPLAARSGRPIFKGQRLVVFEWQLDDCVQTLGKLTDSFDLHAWFFTLDQRLAAANVVLPKRDGGRWLQAELVKEAKTRRLPVAGNLAESSESEHWAWQCKSCGDVHEGTAAEHGRCLKQVREA